MRERDKTELNLTEISQKKQKKRKKLHKNEKCNVILFFSNRAAVHYCGLTTTSSKNKAHTIDK